MRNLPRGLFITGTDTGVGKTCVAAHIARALVAEGRQVGVYKPAASGCARQGDRLVSEDAVVLWNAAGRPGELDRVCPQCFAAPLAPHLAARAEGREIDAALLRQGIEYWRQRSEIVLVEGAGGLMSPMGERQYVADLAEAFGYPLIVVSRNVLGTINQTLQTLIAAAAFGGGFASDSRSAAVSAVSGGQDARAPVSGRPATTSTFAKGTVPFSSDENWDSPQLVLGQPLRKQLPGGGLPVAGVVLNHPALPPSDDASLATNREELQSRSPRPILAELFWQADDFDAVVDWFSLAR